MSGGPEDRPRLRRSVWNAGAIEDVVRIGGHALRILSAHPGVGLVASVFRHGLNVLLDNDANPTLISIQTADVPLHPFGVQIESLPAVAEGQRVFQNAESLHFGSGECLDWGRASVDELRIQPLPMEEAEQAQRKVPLLNRLLAEGAERPSDDPLHSQIDSLLAAWRATGEARVLPGLIGLGAGSTPAGDDVLIGLLAGWTSLREVDEHACSSLGVLHPVLSGMALRLMTHAASAQMIEAALDESFPEPLRDLVAILGTSATDEAIRAAANRVLALGATSGQMMLRGFNAAFD